MGKWPHLKRLSRIWLDRPVFFITVCTCNRRRVLAEDAVVSILRHEWHTARIRHGWLVGRYVVMPDHVHFFCAEAPEGSRHPLSRFVGCWKEWSAKTSCRTLFLDAPLWQERFFDHALRSDESYSQKWAYVRDNPVRAGLAESWEEWPWQGFVDFDAPK